MSDEVIGAEGAESPTAAETLQPTGQAPSQPEQQPQGQPQTVPYERFQQVNARMRQYEQAFNQVNARLKQLEQQREQSGQPVSDEEQQLKAARDAFYGKVAPELRDVPQLIQGLAQERFVSSGERMIETFAEAHGLDAAALSNQLAEIIQSDPELYARARKGDVRLVTQYLKGLEPVVAARKQRDAEAERQQTAQLAANKQQLTRTVPPRQAGGQSGAAAPKPLSGDFRKDIAMLNDQADQMLRAGRQG